MEFDAVQALGAPGWAELRIRGEPAVRVLAKFEERDGRGVVTRLLIVGDGLDSQTLRALPLSRAESVANHPLYGFARGISNEIDPEALRDLAERGELFPAEFAAIDEALDSFVRKAPRPHPDWEWDESEATRKPLQRPDGTDPDGFSRQVAAAYGAAVLRTSAPAKALAEEAGVPVGTVHRWIREARQRGHLAPAKKGRAG